MPGGQDRLHGPMAKLLAVVIGVMIVPPILAGVLGTLKLALVVGILSIFVGLVATSVVVSRWELGRRPPPAELPEARVVSRR